MEAQLVTAHSPGLAVPWSKLLHCDVESHIQQVAMTARCRSVNVSDAAADTFTL